MKRVNRKARMDVTTSHKHLHIHIYMTESIYYYEVCVFRIYYSCFFSVSVHFLGDSLLQMPCEQSHDAVTSIGKYGCHAQSRTTIECAGKT